VARLAASVEVDATVEQTWDAAVDWQAQSQWTCLSSVRATSGGGRGLNATIEAKTGLGPLSLNDPMEIAEWDPPHRLVLRHVGPFVRGDATWEVTGLPGGRSRFEWSEVLESPGFLLAGVYVLGVPVLGVLMRVSVARFSRWAPRRHR
jgi:hypothetical protein